MPIPDMLPVPLPADADYTRQSFEIPGTAKPGQTGERDVGLLQQEMESLTIAARDYSTQVIIVIVRHRIRVQPSARSTVETSNQAPSLSSVSTRPTLSSMPLSSLTLANSVYREPVLC